MNFSKAPLGENLMQMFIEQKWFYTIVSDPKEIFNVIEKWRHVYEKPL